MSSRIQHIAQHVSASSDVKPQPTAATQTQTLFGKVGSKNANDVVIVAAARTAIAKANRGSFKDVTPDTILLPVLDAVVKRAGIDYKLIGDCQIGNVQTIGSYVTPGRAAQIRAGYPPEVPFATVNRQCSSGSQAIVNIATAIASGIIDCGVAGGVEHMSSGGNPSDPSSLPPMDMGAIFEHPIAKDTLTPMGITSENVAEKYKLSRQTQDELAVKSHAKALEAQKKGLFKDQIVPITVTVKDKDGNEKEVTVSQDEGPKAGTTLEVLGKLKPAFKQGGTTTAGNSSQVSDGAAAVLLMRRSLAEKLGKPILGVFRGAAVVGVDPSVMGIGPAYAIPALLQQAGLSVKDIDTFELNEAFASQAVWCQQQLGIPDSKLNPNGGAIALGHPLGCTGARLTTDLLYHMKRNGQKLGVVSMCIGGGQGHASLFESQ